ncbi:flagellar hook-associated protein FlgK [Nocardioides sp.]|uniref:flagellar hook-associated protein FlgK n=1 Tax=Nocardioides sp. TaxID=35761 RepID=UPI002638FAFC|nr:flagellar hook-associated protein FlgK [Nocardioides sp.]
MTGTFSGLNTALSALRYQQVVMDVASNNVSNVKTEGYVRRQAVAAEVGNTGQSAMYAFYDGHGDGVKTQSVQRVYDALIDARVRRENAKLSYLTTTQTILSRVETAINEPGTSGINAAISDFNASLQDLTSNPGGQSARQTVVAKADALAAAIRTQSANITDEAADQRSHAGTAVQQINAAASQLADLNRSIYTAENNGTDVGALYDQRDLVALSLAKLVGGQVTVASDGRYNVSVANAGGTPSTVALVTGDKASTLTMATSATGDLSYSIGGTALNTATGTLSGELGAVTDVVNDTLKTQKAALDTLAQTLVTQLNAANAAGKDKYGDAGGDLLAFGDPTDLAGSLKVADAVVADPGLIAASANVNAPTPPATGPLGTNANGGGPDEDGGNADKMSIATTITSDYAAMVTSFGVKVAAVNTQTKNQTTLTSQVTDEQQQLAGVNLDEETVNLVAAQHAYEAASKVIQTLDSILDTLINMKQ